MGANFCFVLKKRKKSTIKYVLFALKKRKTQLWYMGVNFCFLPKKTRKNSPICGD